MLERFIGGCVVACALATASIVAHAAWPDRPVTVIVPYAAGGGTDATGRIIAALLEKKYGQPFNVVNRTGGGGAVGHTAMAQAVPDGYTIGIMTFEISTYAPMGVSNISYRDYTPIALYNFDPAGFQVKTDSPFMTLKEALDAIKANPAKYKMSGGGGVGGSWHLAMSGMFMRLGLDPMKVIVVPSNGAAPGLTELVAGGVDFIPCSLPEAKALMDAGRVRSLGVMGASRISAFPNVPTMKESTGIDHVAGAWRGVVGPKGMPADATAQLVLAMEEIYASKEFREFMAARGFGLDWAKGADFEKFLAKAASDTGAVVKAVGLEKKQ